MSDSLAGLEARTIYILREAYRSMRPLGMLWSMGKDSTALLWLVRKSFFGKVPFPVILLDTGMELPEVYEFRDRLIRDWKLECINHQCPPEAEMDQSLLPATRSAARKIEGLKTLLEQHKFKGIIAGIRRDEQGLRGKERVFSPRRTDGSWDFKNQPAELWDQFHSEVPQGTHMRIHPILHWSELEIWRYTRQENIPCVPLYFSRQGKRYRSLGESNITFPVESNASSLDEIIAELETTKISERAGRAMDNESEDSFELLRARGYM